MADIFQTSISGLLAFQRALATTSHNVSNVNTPGYSRQRTEFTTLTPHFGSGGWIGTGVGIDAIRRLADDHLTQSVRSNSSEFARLDAFAQLSERVDNLLADQKAGLLPAMQAFFDAVQAAAADPTSAPTRNVMLTEAQNLASRFHFLDARLAELDAEINHRIELTIDEINEMASAIARLNQDIATGLGRSQGLPPNDLLDKRDLLLEQIAERVGVQVVEQPNGMVSVFIGNGQALVNGVHTNRLVVAHDEYDPTRAEIAIASGSDHVRISRQISGGALGGMLDFRRESLDPLRNELGLTARALIMQFNAQHAQGVSFDGGQARAGGEFFKDIPVLVQASERNTGTELPTVSINPDQLGELTNSDYRLRYDAGGWQLIRLNDGHAWSLPASPAPDGLEITLPANPAEGDSFLIRPTHDVARHIEVALRRPEEIAWANPLLAAERTGPNGEALNRGNGQISRPQFSGDVATLLQSGPVTLTYSEDADGAGNPGFIVTGATTTFIPYDGTPGSFTLEVDAGSIHFDFAGTPQEGDAFVIEPNANGRGDNSNLLVLAGVKDRPVLNGGDASLQEFYSGMVGRVGALTLRANVNRDAQGVLLEQAQAARDSVSGVNLEEEAADMLRYQQAYQASAQMVVVANSLFQSLLDAVGR
ncbi:MAG: flagellar hook-associated protein FlgK [Xanthomonadaceae bacterium]|nr:flagellar hook-associated protein FlgK [Xanthomonadaceae bacterium]